MYLNIQININHMYSEEYDCPMSVEVENFLKSKM